MPSQSCACPKCVDLCRKNPGWFTPDEARQAIAAGLADKLMCDWLEPSTKVGNTDRIYLLAPAADDRGAGMAPEWDEMHGGGGGIFSMMMGPPPYKGRCVFLQENDRCAIHDSGFKPRQCREALACSDVMLDNYKMARLWNNEDARAIVAAWRKQVDCPEEKEESV
jgi:Fe-S-cluster containining protein